MRSDDKPDPIEEARAEGKAIVDREFANLDAGGSGRTSLVDDGGSGDDDVPVGGDAGAIGTGDTGDGAGDELETADDVDDLEQVANDAADRRNERDANTRAEQDAEDKAKGVDRAGQVRDEKGQWRKETNAEKTAREAKAAAAPAAPAADTTVPAKPDAAAPAADPAALASAAEQLAAEHVGKLQWTGLGVKVKDQMLEFPEASFAKVGDHMMIRVPLDKVPAFQSRLATGGVAERLWREIGDAKRDLDREKDAPKAETDEQIESKLITEALKPYLAEVLTPEQVENLELKIQLAQHAAKAAHATARKTYFDDLEKKERESGAGAESEQVHTDRVTHALFQVARGNAGFQGMTEPELRAAHAELLELRNLITVQGENWLYDEARITRALENAKGKRTAASAPAAPAAATGTPAPAGTTPVAATPAAGNGTNDPKDRADLHNDGARAGVKQGSTSLRDKRDLAPTRRNGNAGAPPGSRRSPDRQKSAAQIAEDESRASTNRFLRSNTLDFDEG